MQQAPASERTSSPLSPAAAALPSSALPTQAIQPRAQPRAATWSAVENTDANTARTALSALPSTARHGVRSANRRYSSERPASGLRAACGQRTQAPLYGRSSQTATLG